MSAANTNPEIDFQLTRIFDAPRELIYQAWTEAQHLEKWWGPLGFSLRVVKLDLQPGGVFHYAMKMPDGPEMFGKFVYREIEPNRMLTYVLSFADADEKLVVHPLSPTWPPEILSAIELFDEDGQTRAEFWSTPINSSREQEQTFLEERENMQQRFSGTLDKLEAYLATL
ncbi:SRPBCC domain-containing protein [Blastopirellula sp. J2-11]|uniref:SRPBCC family protein n=1 Tax=Blastopirellula sp. J2-11 TaxID=2943192 RepID=UPI0021C7520A|nr:SRPBCC domain-containing protein [Blastopirellula sp. J2-11]UUO08884.1 SRPBCC domain-containing protein [Blastopirellula sp. J2-11]